MTKQRAENMKQFWLLMMLLFLPLIIAGGIIITIGILLLTPFNFAFSMFCDIVTRGNNH